MERSPSTRGRRRALHGVTFFTVRVVGSAGLPPIHGGRAAVLLCRRTTSPRSPTRRSGKGARAHTLEPAPPLHRTQTDLARVRVCAGARTGDGDDGGDSDGLDGDGDGDGRDGDGEGQEGEGDGDGDGDGDGGVGDYNFGGAGCARSSVCLRARECACARRRQCGEAAARRREPGPRSVGP